MRSSTYLLPTPPPTHPALVYANPDKNEGKILRTFVSGGCPPPSPPPSPPISPFLLTDLDTKQGLEIRELKKSKPDKATIKPHIDALLSLKAQYKDKAGKDYAPSPAAAAAPADSGAASKKEALSGGGASVAESPAAAETSAKIVAKVWCGLSRAIRRIFSRHESCVFWTILCSPYTFGTFRREGIHEESSWRRRCTPELQSKEL